ncbi:MAG: tRNA glutamyl-Q(34) synthetase GluQRS [Proteobacteria bacterium]|nr:tRNA glutamyl-Q(34) synthetase GluQRS [Pseudomonadota bacterium]
MPPETVTRFAPSATGHLHLGHAFAALIAAGEAARTHGRFLVRIEDIDTARARSGFEDAIFEDLAWLGLEWETPVRRQSDHFADYQAALARLEDMGLLYPCFCTRKEIRAEIEAAGRAPHGPDGPLYPGTCRGLDADARDAQMAEGRAYALRLDVAKAVAKAGPLTWRDRARGELAADPASLGDVVLARKETATSYHLAVTLDDADQGITLVTRGEDLFHTTHVHRLLQALLGLPVPEWHHHGLITGPDGARLAKRSDAHSIRALREAGKSPAEVRALAGFAD